MSWVRDKNLGNTIIWKSCVIKTLTFLASSERLSKGKQPWSEGLAANNRKSSASGSSALAEGSPRPSAKKRWRWIARIPACSADPHRSPPLAGRRAVVEAAAEAAAGECAASERSWKIERCCWWRNSRPRPVGPPAAPAPNFARCPEQHRHCTSARSLRRSLPGHALKALRYRPRSRHPTKTTERNEKN